MLDTWGKDTRIKFKEENIHDDLAPEEAKIVENRNQWKKMGNKVMEDDMFERLAKRRGSRRATIFEPAPDPVLEDFKMNEGKTEDDITVCKLDMNEASRRKSKVTTTLQDIEVDMEPVRQNLNRRASLALYKKVRSKSRNEADEVRKVREMQKIMKKEEDDYTFKQRLDRMNRPIINPLTGLPVSGRLSKTAKREVRDCYKSKIQEYREKHPEKDKNANLFGVTKYKLAGAMGLGDSLQNASFGGGIQAKLDMHTRVVESSIRRSVEHDLREDDTKHDKWQHENEAIEIHKTAEAEDTNKNENYRQYPAKPPNSPDKATLQRKINARKYRAQTEEFRRESINAAQTISPKATLRNSLSHSSVKMVEGPTVARTRLPKLKRTVGK